jgi:glutathione peroxidase|uniref:Glutathione peroxidase n=1 Tax=Globisporangium ultimum (strain ATCC 200006 / CBS 805.95 / DAOM BR144) TaxID=431595 RepID=K3WJ92_GLOUD
MAQKNLEGRVYARLQRFEGLPEDLKEDTRKFQTYLVENKASVFQIHHSALIKAVYSVKGKALIESIAQWLHTREAPATEAAEAAAPATEAVEEVAASVTEAAVDEAPAAAATAHEEGAAPAEEVAPATETPAPVAAAPAPISAETRERARQIAESLVLSGFLTLHKDDEKRVNAPPPDHYVRDNDLLVPIAKEVTELKTTSVWSVLDGAIYAKLFKRKAGILAPFTNGKDVYVVFNDKTKKAYLFESDLAKAAIAEFDGATVKVEFDHAFFEFGVRVSLASGDDKEKPELFNAGTKHLQEEFVNVWLNIGAQYRETFHGEIENVKSIYELKDTDISGTEITFDKYKGKVLLVVNVSSNCGLTPTNYPELTALDEKYRDQGLVILAFPCNQFGSQEPGTNEEIVEFVKQYNAQYQFFEKADVNGPHARPVFAYLKAKLPGTFGNYIKWNFTKFLVDRNGQPFKRFAPTDKPLSFEHDIQELLSAEADPEVLEEEKPKEEDTPATTQSDVLVAAPATSEPEAPAAAKTEEAAAKETPAVVAPAAAP